MSGFKDMVAKDVHSVFLNLDEFAEKRTIRYDGEEYQDPETVPCCDPCHLQSRNPYIMADTMMCLQITA